MKGVFFKAQVYQKSGMGFTLCDHSLHFTNILYKSIFTTFFSCFKKIIEMGRIPLWYYSCLSKFWGALPKVYKRVCGYFLSKIPLGYDFPFQ
jgi:hypothetical protein